MQYIEIIQTQSATVVETIKVRIPVPEGKTQEEWRHHIEGEGLHWDLCQKARADTEGVKIERSYDWHDPEFEMKDVTK